MTEKYLSELKRLRERIDEIDKEIISLLEKRLEIAQKIGKIKARASLPIQDEKREKEVLQRAGKFACVFKEIISLCKRAQLPKKIGIVGFGKMGVLFASELSKLCEIVVYSKNLENVKDERIRVVQSLAELFKEAECIILAVPENSAKNILEELVNLSRKTEERKIIFDICTFKKYLEKHYENFPPQVKVCSVHPMFGAGAKSFEGKKVLLVKVCKKEIPCEVKILFSSLGARIIEIESVEEHDKLMQVCRGIPYFLGLTYLTFVLKYHKSFEVGGTSFEYLTTYGKSLLNDSDEFINHILSKSSEKITEFLEFIKNVKIDLQKLRNTFQKEVGECYKKFYKLVEG